MMVSIKKAQPLLRDLVLFTIMALLVLVFWRNNIMTGGVLLLEFLASMIFLYKYSDRVFFVLTGVFGTVLEIIGAWTGIWTYTYPNLITVPFWIFFCWGFTFTLFHQLYLKFAKD